jgi:hypothetical protein
MNMALNAGQSTSASSHAIEAAFKRLEVDFIQGRWLTPTNKYASTGDEIQRDLRSGSIARRDMCEFIAASAPTHCIDGWAFWGRALDAHLRGDVDAAKHFAYYASLRGALSFLATRGIGIFHLDHVVVDAGGNCIKIDDRSDGSRIGTHSMLWEALNTWSGLNGSDAHLLSVVRPEGHTLFEWVDAFGGTPGAITAITLGWTKVWGLDLLVFQDDRQARNYASYRPSELNQRQQSTTKAVSDFACDVWKMLEPANSRFNGLDLHLLRLSLQRAFAFRRGKKHTLDPHAFEADVRNTVASFFKSPSQIDRLTDYLVERTAPGSPTLFSEALKRNQVKHPTQHLQVIARAAFILRLASGSVERLVINSGVLKTSLTTWLSPFLAGRGIWSDPSSLPAALTDLWEDVSLAIDYEQDWHRDNPLLSSCILPWREAQGRPISILGDGERIAAWSWGL